MCVCVCVCVCVCFLTASVMYMCVYVYVCIAVFFLNILKISQNTNITVFNFHTKQQYFFSFLVHGKGSFSIYLSSSSLSPYCSGLRDGLRR